MVTEGFSKASFSNAPFTMHEFFAGSGLVAYALKNFFTSIWANDLDPKKATIYKANFGGEHLKVLDLKKYRVRVHQK